MEVDTLSVPHISRRAKNSLGGPHDTTDPILEALVHFIDPFHAPILSNSRPSLHWLGYLALWSRE
jgi:hypothetical protein